MRRAKNTTEKVNTGYLLPVSLVRRVRVQAAKEGVRPCHVAERLLLNGLKREKAAEAEAGADTTTDPEPAAASA